MTVYKQMTQALVASMLLAVGAAGAAEENGGFALTLGGAYRFFDDVDYSAATLPGSISAAPFGLQNLAAVQPSWPAPVISYDFASFAGTSVDSDDAAGLVLGAEYQLSSADNGVCSWLLVGNFSYFGMDADQAPGANGIVAGNAQSDVVALIGGNTIMGSLPGSQFPGFLPGTTVTGQLGYEMDLFVLDLGLEAEYKKDWLSLGVAAGPTVNFAQVDTETTFVANYLPVPNAVQPGGAPVGTTTTQRTQDDDSEVLLGLYFALSAGVNVSESVTVGLGYRYDWVADEAGTSQAELDLSGHTISLELKVRF